MTRVICCNRFLSQSVLSPDWPVGCLCCSDNRLIVASGPGQLTILEWVNADGSGLQLRQCGRIDTGLPVIQVRCCPKSGLLVALCSAAESSVDRGGTVCRAYLNWTQPDTSLQQPCSHTFSEYKRANLIRVDEEKVAIAEGRSVSIYVLTSSQPMGFDLATVLQLDFVLTQLEVGAATGCLLAAAANRILLLQLRPRPQLSVARTGRDTADSVNSFSLFDFDDLAVSPADAVDESRQTAKPIQLDAKAKARLFPATKSVGRVAFSSSAQLTIKVWLLNTLALQGEDRLHSLALWHLDPKHLMCFFSTHDQGFIYCLIEADGRIEKLMELRYNSIVYSAVVGADGLLHTMSTDLVESYTTHQPLCRLTSSIASTDSGAASVTVPNLLIGSQMFPGIVALAAHSAGLLLVSSAADEDEPAGGRLLSTLYSLTFEPAASLVEDLIDKCLLFRQDSEDIYRHLACEAAFLLHTSASAGACSAEQRRKLFLFAADLIRDQPQDLIAARLLLDYLQPGLDQLAEAVSTDPAKLLQSGSLVSYIRDGLVDRTDFQLPHHESPSWPCLEQLLQALLGREGASTSAALLVRLLAALPSNGPTLPSVCAHQLPRLSPGSLLRCLAARYAGGGVGDSSDDGVGLEGLSESEICDSLPDLAELMPLEQFAGFFQELFSLQPLAVCSAFESMDRGCEFAGQLPWPLSIYFAEVRWLEPMLAASAADASTDCADFDDWAGLLVQLLAQAAAECRQGDGCKLPIDVSLATPAGVLKRLLSVLYNLPGMEAGKCCCLAFVAQRVLLLLWLRPNCPPPAGFDTLCDHLKALNATLALCVSQAPLLLIGCRDELAAANPQRAVSLLPLLRLEAVTRRRLIGCLRLNRSDWLVMIEACAGGRQSDCDAILDLASEFADRATLKFLLELASSSAAEDELMLRCASRESLRSRRDELTRLLAGQLAEQ